MADEPVEPETDEDGNPLEPEVKPLGLLEIGTTGLAATGGYINEEPLPELKGVRGREVFRQMSENDSVIGAFLFALNQMISRLDWHWEAPEDADEIESASTDFVGECWEDMNEPWDAVLEDVLSFSTYGWSFSEVVYKIRRGPDQEDGAYRSRFNDGRIGWRKFAPRGQNTILRWVLDTNGEILGMVQIDPWKNTAAVPAMDEPAKPAGEVYIPLTKAALFRITQSKNNPEGRSLLRQAYRPWLFKTRIEEFEAIGIERDLVGYPVVTTPAAWHLPTASAADKAALKAAVNLVKNMRRGNSEGAVIPAMYDEEKNKIFAVELITSGGSRQIDINAVLQRKDAQIAMSVLADFLMLGHEDVGTRSLGIVKVDLWTLAVQAVAKSIAEVMNRHVVPKLLYLNGFAPSRTPKLSFGDVNRVDLAALAPFLKVLLDAQVLTPDTDLEEWARNLINAPPKKPDPFEDDPLTMAALLGLKQKRGNGPGPALTPAPAATPTQPALEQQVPQPTPAHAATPAVPVPSGTPAPPAAVVAPTPRVGP